MKLNWIIPLFAAAGLALAGCGGGGSSTPPAAEVPPPPTPYEVATAAIAAADTAEDVDAALAAAEAAGGITAAQLRSLEMAVAERKTALAMMDRETAQKTALMNAAGMIDTSDLSTQAAIDAAETAIAALEAAIAAAVDVDDTSMYQAQVTAAETAVASAQSMLDHAAQTMALSGALEALQAIDLTDLSTQANIDAAQAAIDAVQAALDAATELSAAEKTAAMTELGTASRTVMTAQGTFDTDAQKAALAEAAATLAALDLDNLMTQEDIDAAVAAITGVNLALEAATNLTDAEKLDATVDVTVAQRKVDRAEMALAENVDGQRMALMTAGTALGEIDLEDLSDQAKIDAAQAAVDALEMALNAATHLSDSEKATYQTQLDMATETVRTAQTGMDRDGRMMAQRTAITNAVTMARTAVGNVDDDSTDSEVASADAAIAALKAAIEGAEDLPEGDTDVASAQGTLATLEPQLAAAKTSRMTAMAEADKARQAAMAKTGKALYAALGPPGTGVTQQNALGNLDLATAPETDLSDGLTIDATQGAGVLPDTTDGNPASVDLKVGASAGALGSWMGTNYAHTNTGTKVVNEARVYTNQGPGKREAFADALPTGVTIATANAGGIDATRITADTTAIKGYIPVVATGTVTTGLDITKVMADAFTHSGTQSHAIPGTANSFTARGTYDGASGEYRCVTGCSSTNNGTGAPSELGGTWFFKPDADAMVHQPDANYLYYGWWVSKDKDGDPTAASAFTGVNGAIAALASDPVSAVTGSATYAGHAAGKFAMSNVLDGTGSGGHFTADAMLTAKFGANTAPNNGGVSGTINNFMANGESVPWSVALHRAEWGTNGAFTSMADTTNTTADGTTWSIDGNAAPESGVWSGQMYDEMPGDAPDGDGSNIPTTVTGTFYSEFGTIGRMVGAFGANKE